MSPRKKTTAKSTSKAIANWDEELARQAQEQIEQEKNTGGGQFFSLQGGQLRFDGDTIPGNEMAVVILDSVHENVLYQGDYDPDNPSGPICFAFGRDPDEMAPHEKSLEPQAETCAECPNNVFGSAERGNGKACKNRRRLALISAGNLEDGEYEPCDDEVLQNDEVAYLATTVTSAKGFSNYAKKIAKTFSRPLHAVVTRVKVVSDPKWQFKLLFESLGKIPNEQLGIVMERHSDVREEIEFPYQQRQEEESTPPQRGKKGGVNVKKTTKKRVAKKRSARF